MNIDDQGNYEFDKPELRALIEFTSKDDTRQHINSVWFDPANGRACATDGHALLIVSGAAKVDKPHWLLSREDLACALKSVGRRERILIMRPRGTDPKRRIARIVIHEKGFLEPSKLRPDWARIVLKLRAVDATFPPVDAVVPNYSDPERLVAPFKESIGLSPKLLARLQFVSNAGCAVRFGNGPLDPATFEWSFYGLTWLVILMPMRI